MSATAKQIAVVQIPGAYCPGRFFHKTTERFEKLGYAVVEVDLPSNSSSKEPASGVYDDAAHVNELVKDFADRGYKVVLLANSYGTFVACEAGKGLTMEERCGQGQSGGLIANVFIGSLLPPLGVTCHDLVGEHVPVPTQSDSAYMPVLTDLKLGGSLLCGSLSDEDQIEYAAMCRPQSAASQAEATTHASYTQIPTLVVVPTKDRALPIDLQHRRFDEAASKGIPTISKTTIDADHVAMLSEPDKVVEILLKFVRDLQ